MTNYSICVFCGSRPGLHQDYTQAAQDMGTAIAQNGWRLVYGAGDVGLMGTVANAVQQAKGETFGVIPMHLVQQEVAKTDLNRFVITENMHERKKVMFMNSDALVVLPGGAGSLDEFFEVLTWRQLGLHDKPIFLLNVQGYWAPLLALLGQIIEQGFADQSLADLVTAVPDVETLVPALRAHQTGTA